MLISGAQGDSGSFNFISVPFIYFSAPLTNGAILIFSKQKKESRIRQKSKNDEIKERKNKRKKERRNEKKNERKKDRKKEQKRPKEREQELFTLLVSSSSSLSSTMKSLRLSSSFLIYKEKG
jgi:hypothetical protein